MLKSVNSLPKASVGIRTVSGRSILRLKSWASGANDVDPKVRIASLELPWEVGATQAGELRALCTGPSDWLLVAPGPLSSLARSAIEADCVHQGLALVDLSSGLSVLEVSGSATRDALAQGTGLDLDSRVFAAGSCARTRLAGIAAVIECLQSPHRLDLYVPRSVTAYLQEWLYDAAAGLGQ